MDISDNFSMDDLDGIFWKEIDLSELPESKLTNEHSVIIEFNEGLDGLEEIHELEKKLRDKLEGSDKGWWDGHELGMDTPEGMIFLYGKNAEELFKEVKPILEMSPLMKGAIAYLSFGPPSQDTPVIEVELDVQV